MSVAIVDGELRQRAAQEVETSFALSAGAGSGKTTVLVERLVQHLLSGTEPSRMAAITFTEKAAGDLLARARDALEANLAVASGEQEARLSNILERFGELTLSTIHSFCSELLRQEALDARWAPDTEVQDGRSSGVVAECYHQWRAGFDHRHPELAVRMREGLITEAARFANTPTLREAALALLDNRDLAPSVTDATEVDWELAHRELIEVADRLEASLKKCRDAAACKLVAKLRPCVGEIAAAAGCSEAAVAVRLAMGIAEVKTGRLGTQKHWAAADKDAVKQAQADFHGWQTRWQAAEGEVIHRLVILDLMEHFVPAVAQAKRAAAQADYADLLFGAAELLSGHEHVRARLARRYEVILIDEVQDTDPIQAEVAVLLTRVAAQRGPWNSAAPRPGSLFAVGDPKQSIYRFRRADVETWRELQTLITEGGGARLSLRQNFRSVPGLVHWVNLAFAHYPEYEAQVPFRPPARVDPVVVVCADADEEGAPIDEVRALVRHLRDLEQRGAEVWDKGLEAYRPMRFSDVMVLLPSWTRAEAVQDTLSRAGIDSVLEGGSGFFERDEVRLLLDAMRAVEEPADGEATVAVLRGLFGVSHREMAEFKRDGGSWTYTLPRTPAGAIAEAFEFLRHLHAQRGRKSWVALLEDLLEHTRATCVWALKGRRWSALANIDKLFALIHELEPRTRSPRETISTLEQLESAGAEDLSVLDTDLDAVRVTTYFKAKGLESPIVALVHAERKFIKPNAVVRRGERQLAVALGKSVTPPDWEAHQKREQEELLEERRRWIYVAVTRARDQLVVVHSRLPEDPRKRAAYDSNPEKPLTLDIFDAMGPFGEEPHDTLYSLSGDVQVRLHLASALPAVAWQTETFPGLDEAVDALLAEPPSVGDPEGEQRAEAMHIQLQGALRASTRWRSVGQLTQRRIAEFEGGGVGPRGGTVVHQVMEHLDLAQPPEVLRGEVPSLLRAFATQSGIDDELAERCEQIVYGLLDHPVIAEARRAPERWREVPFAFPDKSGRIVSGKIDLCFPVDEARTRWKVVDWKSHLPPAGSPLRQQYQAQLAYYVRAILATVTPCEDVDAVLVGPHEAIGHADRLAEKLELVHPDLVDLLMDLADAGIEPEVGVEVELGERRYVELELVWTELQVGLGLDLPATSLRALEELGWRIVNTDTRRATWTELAAEGLHALVGGEQQEDAP